MIVDRLRKRAAIRRQIPTRKSVQEGKRDRLAELLDEAARHIETLEALRPHWAQGFSDDGIAAQVQTAALSQLWKMLGVDNQTAAVQRLASILAAKSEDTVEAHRAAFMDAITSAAAPAVRPCPYCGETPDVNDLRSFRETDGPKWGALQCCGMGPEVRTNYEPVEKWRDRAIEAWNRRP